MSKKTNALCISLFAVVTVAGCNRSEPSNEGAAAGGGMPGMPNMQQSGQRPEHIATGTINSVDAAAGRVNITHGPIASASWPGMTMTFKLADTAAGRDLKPGQRVEFHFTIESGMDATVTEIKAVD
jgi:Cu/Ag efflux protein CusF